jgi:hypothetical protein
LRAARPARPALAAVGGGADCGAALALLGVTGSAAGPAALRGAAMGSPVLGTPAGGAGGTAAGLTVSGRAGSMGGPAGPADAAGGTPRAARRSAVRVGRGGAGGATARRTSALISAIERVSGRASVGTGAGFFAAGGAGAGAATEGSGAEAAGASSAAAPDSSMRKCSRTLSATSSSMALECECLSVTPISGRKSKMARLFTSSSRARSLIRILLISPLYSSSTLNMAD